MEEKRFPVSQRYKNYAEWAAAFFKWVAFGLEVWGLLGIVILSIELSINAVLGTIMITLLPFLLLSTIVLLIYLPIKAIKKKITSPIWVFVVYLVIVLINAFYYGWIIIETTINGGF